MNGMYVIEEPNNCIMSEKECCPPLPHYKMPISDSQFVVRNIELTNSSGEKWNPMTGINAAYPGGGEALVNQTKALMDPCERSAFRRQEQIARRWNYNKWYYQDLNQGRRGYARGLSDDLDLTMAERNNFPSGWLNARNAENFTSPGNIPYRDPYCENDCPPGVAPAYNPQSCRKPMVNMDTMGSRTYKWDTIYQKERYPNMFCRSGEFNYPVTPNPRCYPSCYNVYPEEYQ